MHSVERGRSVVRLMDGVLLDVRLLDSSDHVEVNRVAAELERLADVGELAILDPAHDGLIPGRVKHDVGAILVRSRGLRVAPENKFLESRPTSALISIVSEPNPSDAA